MSGRVIIYGGSFDPPHRAHVELPRRVRELLDADTVVYVPVGVPPHKSHAISAAGHRLAMLRLALADEHATAIDTFEIDRATNGEPTYTVDTLEALRHKLPGSEMRLLIGADQMRDFHTWKNPARIVELAEPVVMARADIALPDASWRGRVVRTPVIDVSATGIRRRVRQGEPIAGLVHPEVERYIARHGLYRDVTR